MLGVVILGASVTLWLTEGTETGGLADLMDTFGVVLIGWERVSILAEAAGEERAATLGAVAGAEGVWTLACAAGDDLAPAFPEEPRPAPAGFALTEPANMVN